MLKGLMRGVLPLCMFLAASGVQAVEKSSPNDSRFMVNGDTVYDKKLDLTWARCSIGLHWVADHGCIGSTSVMTYQNAQAQVTESWRLPTKAELESLISRDRLAKKQQPAVDEKVFPDMHLTKLVYWASAPDTPTGSIVYFGIGRLTSYDLSIPHAVRLVKNGQ